MRRKILGKTSTEAKPKLVTETFICWLKSLESARCLFILTKTFRRFLLHRYIFPFRYFEGTVLTYSRKHFRKSSLACVPGMLHEQSSLIFPITINGYGRQNIRSSVITTKIVSGAETLPFSNHSGLPFETKNLRKNFAKR